MHRLEKLCNQVLKTNSVVASSQKLSRYLCSEKSKDQGVKDLSENPKEQSSPVSDNDILLENSNQDTQNNNEKSVGGFAESYKRYTAIKEEKKVPKTFASLLRHSKFIDLGEPEGKIVKGKVLHVVGDDLHIDFGWKFNCVCKLPAANSNKYVRGSIVNLKIKELELSTRFLGAKRDITILEADCILLGLVWSPITSNKSQRAPDV